MTVDVDVVIVLFGCDAKAAVDEAGDGSLEIGAVVPEGAAGDLKGIVGEFLGYCPMRTLRAD